MKLEDALETLVDGEPPLEPRELAGRVERRVGVTRRRRGLVALVATVLLALVAGGAWLGWQRWLDRPAPDPFGEAAATVQWTRPPRPSAQVIKERCGAGFVNEQLPLDWGAGVQYQGKTCFVGWERPDASAGLAELPTDAASLRRVCEKQTGKDLAGWQLVAMGDPVDFSTHGDYGRQVAGAFRSANGHLASCWVGTRDGAYLQITPATDVGNVLHTREALLMDDHDLVVTLDGVVGVEGRDNQPDLRARRLVADAGRGFTTCELPVTNGHVAGSCFLEHPDDFRPADALTSMPFTVTVHGRGDRVLRRFTIDQ